MNKTKATFYAFLAAALYALNSPLSKLMLLRVPAAMMAGLLYLGAGLGLLPLLFFQSRQNHLKAELPLTRKELPFTASMIVLDIAAPVFLMIGLSSSSAASASLLNNFEIAATALIALLLFHEPVGKRLWAAIVLVTLASIILSFEHTDSLSFSHGSLFVLLACVCWGFENNCTRKLSSKNPLEIVIVKGFGSGTGSLLIALIRREHLTDYSCLFPALLLGFVAYGLSILFYIYAQRGLGAAKTSTYYAVSPFIGALLSLLLFREIPSCSFFIALLFMLAGTWLANSESVQGSE